MHFHQWAWSISPPSHIQMETLAFWEQDSLETSKITENAQNRIVSAPIKYICAKIERLLL